MLRQKLRVLLISNVIVCEPQKFANHSRAGGGFFYHTVLSGSHYGDVWWRLEYIVTQEVLLPIVDLLDEEIESFAKVMCQ